MRLVLLPGMDGTGDLFEPLLACLPSRLRPVVVRYPADRPLTYRELERHVRNILPASEPYAILGESFSGPIAIGIAASKPGGLLALILSCSFARNPYPKLAGTALFVGGYLPRWVTGAVADTMLLGPYSNNERRSALSSALGQVTAKVLRARLGEVMVVDATEQLDRVAVPLLYLRATGDRVMPESTLKEIQQHSSCIETVDIVGPHGLLQVNPGAAAAAIDRFLPREANAL